MNYASKKDDIDYPISLKKYISILKYPNSDFRIYGSYSLKYQPYYSDIDCVNIVDVKSIGDIIKFLHNVIHTIYKNKSVYFTDFKAGIYPNGKSVHWTSNEILFNRRNSTKEDFNGEFGSKTLINAIFDKSIIKCDIVAKYNDRYIEITCVYLFSINGKTINYNTNDLTQDYIISSLKKDTKKNYDSHKYFKTLKRVYAQARLKDDKRMLEVLYPEVTSNVSKIYSVQSDLRTLELIVKEKHKIDNNFTVNELQFLKDKMASIIDIKYNDEYVSRMFNILSKEVNKREHFLLDISILIKYLFNITNTESLKFINNTNLLQPLNNYFFV